MTYEWSDAWLLLSVIRCAGPSGASRESIVAIGDAMNHAIFTDAELERGTARLVAGGWIMRIDDRLAPTRAAQALHERITRRPGSPITLIDRIAGALDPMLAP